VSGLATADGRGQDRRWSPLAPPKHPLDAADLRGAHDFRHTFATWLEDAGIPARVIDELMGHEPSTRGAQHVQEALDGSLTAVTAMTPTSMLVHSSLDRGGRLAPGVI
jgi:integrase